MIRRVMFTNRVAYSIKHHFVNNILHEVLKSVGPCASRSAGMFNRLGCSFEQPSRSASNSDLVGLSSNTWLFDYLS
ncbi:hypothetical protein HanIR_Chr11g0521391 [Helianthus annuus]|nr:hypothetical protein HanIR_Chr11g0521391 [Helianthus annuus]